MVLRSEPPLTLRRTLLDGPDVGQVGLHLVGSGAGPVGGDDLTLVVGVGPGSHLDLAAVAASMVMPGPHGERSISRIEVDVAAGATLSFLAPPLVLVAGCDHHVIVRVRLGAGARLLWRDEVVLGRHGEAGGSLHQRLAVDLGGRPLLRSDLAVGPRWPDTEGPAGTAGARAVGTVLVVDASGADPPADLVAGYAPRPGVRLAATTLDGPAALVSALAVSGGRLADAFDALLTVAPWSSARPVVS